MNQHRPAALMLAIAALSSPATAAAQTSEAAPFGSPIADETVWLHAVLDQFEGRLGANDALRWEGEAWTGTDADRLWLKSEGEFEKSKVFGGQQEALYDTPLSAWFDLQAGLRYDLDSQPGRAWAAVGIEGLSQYFFHISATAYASDTGHYAAKFFGTYDLLLTQRLILQPEAEINIYSRSDPARLVSSGVSELDTGLRLRYEITRKFAPYIGVAYERRFAARSRLVAAGETPAQLRFAVGLRSWF